MKTKENVKNVENVTEIENCKCCIKSYPYYTPLTFIMPNTPRYKITPTMKISAISESLLTNKKFGS